MEKVSLLRELVSQLQLVVVHQIVVDDDEERLAGLEDLYAGAGPGVGDDHVGRGDVLIRGGTSGSTVSV